MENLCDTIGSYLICTKINGETLTKIEILWTLSSCFILVYGTSFLLLYLKVEERMEEVVSLMLTRSTYSYSKVYIDGMKSQIHVKSWKWKFPKSKCVEVWTTKQILVLLQHRAMVPKFFPSDIFQPLTWFFMFLSLFLHELVYMRCELFFNREQLLAGAVLGKPFQGFYYINFVLS